MHLRGKFTFSCQFLGLNIDCTSYDVNYAFFAFLPHFSIIRSRKSYGNVLVHIRDLIIISIYISFRIILSFIYNCFYRIGNINEENNDTNKSALPINVKIIIRST